MKSRFLSLLGIALTTSAFASNYSTNYPADTHISHQNRALTAITVNVDGLPAQTLDVNQGVGGLLHHDKEFYCFAAPSGRDVNLSLDWTGVWMNSYVYIDINNDGVFDPETELIAYSNLNGVNSAGVSTGNGNVLLPPTFSFPEGLDGDYYVRFKIDWDSNDPGGSKVEGNDIVSNGGAIVDVRFMIDGDGYNISAASTNGSITFADGSSVDGAQVPSSGTLDLAVVPDQGYQFDYIEISAGIGVGSEDRVYVNPDLAEIHTVYAAPMVVDGLISIPVDKLVGDVNITATFIEAIQSTQTYDGVYSGTKSATEGYTALNLNSSKLEFSSTERHTPANAENMVNLLKGEGINLEATFNGAAAQHQLLVDLNQDGVFNTNQNAMSCEIVAFGDDSTQLTGSLPDYISNGVYRARLFAAEHSSVDFFLNVHNATASLHLQPLNALVLTNEDAPFPNESPILTSLKLKTYPAVAGFEPEKVIIRHGQNLSGPQFICGNPQWVDTEGKILSSGSVNVSRSLINGDVEIYVIYTQGEDSEWVKVWGDEFNDDKLDTKRWQYQERYSATWNRLVAQSARQRRLVNTFENGMYNSHCVATPEEFTDETQPMISGAINTMDKFSVKYGRIEARIKTTPHTGNFPAFWMMPAYSELAELGLNGWPKDGEIDIWEQIDAQNRSHHTIHSGWTGWKAYCGWTEAPKVASPQSSQNVACDMGLWHVYALEWDAEELRWYVDGNQVFSYRNQHYSEEGSDRYIEKVTWPFDKHFYIILNQSVGNGSWAANADVNFNYLTLFDYVRVYQKKGEGDYESTFSGNGDDPDFYVPARDADDESSIEEIYTSETNSGETEYYDLHGRRIANPFSTPGLYIEKNGTQANKIIIR